MGEGFGSGAAVPDGKIQGRAKWKFEIKKNRFPRSTNYKLVGQIKGNSTNNCHF